MKPSVRRYFGAAMSAIVLACLFALTQQANAEDLRVLFMGDNGHHRPAKRFFELAPALEKRGIKLQYTDKMSMLNAATLAKFDGLMLYANIDRIEEEQAQAVLKFVADGGGFIPLHCATYCWRNNADMVDLMGAQFQRHGARVFSTEIADADHPVMKGFGGFTSWDETYIHHRHNESDRTVLEYRLQGEQAQGKEREPWTWVRTHGKGRVFYTAWGHDERTFKQPGYHNLVERGVRWACGDDPGKAPAFRSDRFVVPKMKAANKDVKPFEYVDVGPKIPNYVPSNSWGTQGKPKTLMQMPLKPEESLKHYVTPEGFELKLYADEDDFISKPIAMTWDQRGRLWICETLDYPNEIGKDRDRIRICEDTDGDNVADKFTVFAEGLSIPTSIVIYRGGAIVQNGKEALYLKDTNGDDVADLRTTLMTGFAIDDTHGGVSNFRYGLDNWIWAMQGYNNSRPKFGDHESQSFRQGFWRFKLSKQDPPVVTDVEFVRSSDNNTWGLGISEEGLIFGSTANGNPSMFMTIPNRYYEKVRGWAPSTLHSIADTFKFDPTTEKVRQVDWHGGYTAGAGHALYTARAFPQQWWNRTSFVCGPTGHLVGTFVLSPEGANYSSASPMNLVASDDEWSAPIMAEVGPDGAVWVLDWYNYIVQHNPTPNGFERGKGNAYKSDLRDKRHGRIYRVTPTEESRLHEFPRLDKMSNLELVAALRHPSMRWRLHAQRLLVERDAAEEAQVQQALEMLILDPKVDEIGLNVGAIHALHTLDGCGKIELGAAMAAALKHPSAGVRRNAFAVLPPGGDSLAFLVNQQIDISVEEDAQTRLAALLFLADSKSNGDGSNALVKMIQTETDPVLLDAITSAASSSPIGFLGAISKLEASNPAIDKIVDRVAEHVGRDKNLKVFADQIVMQLGVANPTMAARIIDGMTRGLTQTKREEKSSPLLDQTIMKAFASCHEDTRKKLVQLAIRLGSHALDSQVESVVAELTEVIEDEDESSDARLEAALDLIGFQPASSEAVATIMESITPQSDPQYVKDLLGVIRGSESEEAGGVILESIENYSPGIKKLAINVLLGRTAWTRAILDAAESNEYDLDELSLEQKQILRQLPDKSLCELAERLLARDGGLPNPDREKVLQSLMHITEITGDVDSGMKVYKNVCANCHIHGDIGQKVGPNLTGMAVHPKDELLTHIIDPSRSVEGNYRLYKVLKSDGQFISGMLAGESRTSITIIDSEAKRIDVQREDIDELAPSRKSVMPEGFEKQLSEKELTDLLEFLTDTGPYIPVPLDDFATAISTKALFHGPNDEGPDRMVFPDWEPKEVDGIPFILTDPVGKSKKNIVLLNGPNGMLPPKMPKSVAIPLGSKAKAIHLLSGVGGWSFPFSTKKTVSMIVRLTYDDDEVEDHELINGVHIADYIRRVDVPQSKFAFDLNGQQVRYLALVPKRPELIRKIELVKGEDISAPIVMGITIEKLD